ncbi:MAG: rod shape-determining protein [Acidimicrobiales bacterium]
MSGQLAIDLGSTRTLVADTGGRLLVDEPTVAAVNLRDGSLIAFGSPALLLPGRSAGDVSVMKPVSHGQLQDLRLTDQVAEHLLGRVRKRVGRHPEILCSVPGLATGVQKRALERSFKRAGAAHVDFIEHAFAAGIGFKLRIDEPVATMVFDVGGGTTDVAVMALGGVVTEASIPLGGEDLDRAVRDLCLRSYDLVISPALAERVKIVIGTAWPASETKIDVTGRDTSNGMARSVVVSSSEVSAATEDCLRAMVGAAVSCIVTAPPDLANDLIARGLHLAGGAALMTGYARRLATATGIPVHLADDPARAAVMGAARCLRDLSETGARRAVSSTPVESP